MRQSFNRVLIGFAPISISPALAPASARPKIWSKKWVTSHGAFRPIFMIFFPPLKKKTWGCKSGEKKCLVLQHTPMNIHENCCTNAFWKKTVWTLLWRNQSLSFWPVFETSWQLQGLGKEIMNKRAQLEHTQFRKFLDRNSNFVAPALIPFHKAERLQKFEPNPRQRTNLPLGWMFDNLDLLDSITSSCRQNSIVCTAAHKSSKVTSKFRSVESMHITQSLIGSKSHQHPSAVLYTMENATLFLNVRTNGKYRPGCINHSSQNVAKSNYIKQCSFQKATAKGSFWEKHCHARLDNLDSHQRIQLSPWKTVIKRLANLVSRV